ncbi:MAG: hypothetical protein JO269_06215 [Burkholderiaceae bacterium]|nr:hypothetical protein [Burkholderiaceae bacterium]
MAGTKARKPSLEIVWKWIKAGFGQGEGLTYKPFMYVRDVPSIGASRMVKSWTTGRNHHYLSRQEYKVHLLAEYSRWILDIREQFVSRDGHSPLATPGLMTGCGNLIELGSIPISLLPPRAPSKNQESHVTTGCNETRLQLWPSGKPGMKNFQNLIDQLS